MAFNTIVIDTRTFNSTGTGLYSLSTAIYGAAMNALRIIPGKKAGKTGPTSFSVTRLLEKDVTEGTTVTRRKLSVSVQCVVPSGFTALEVDNAVADISTFLTEATVNRVLLGES